jgi:hypothetical protein
MASFDFKLTAIIKLLQAWMTEKRTEIEKNKVQTQYGAGAWNPSNNNVNFQINNPYNPGNFF